MYRPIITVYAGIRITLNNSLHIKNKNRNKYNSSNKHSRVYDTFLREFAFFLMVCISWKGSRPQKDGRTASRKTVSSTAALQAYVLTIVPNHGPYIMER